MKETLLAYTTAILAVGLAMVLRLRRSIREASAEIAALRKKLAALQQRTRELERAQRQADESARDVRFREKVPAPELAAYSSPFSESQKELYGVLNRLRAIEAQLPFDPTVEQKYITEFDRIVDRLERASGCDLSRWLGVPPQEGRPSSASGPKTGVSKAAMLSRDRSFFRLRIFSLQAFCNYQIYHSQPPGGFAPRSPGATRLVH